MVNTSARPVNWATPAHVNTLLLLRRLHSNALPLYTDVYDIPHSCTSACPTSRYTSMWPPPVSKSVCNSAEPVNWIIFVHSGHRAPTPLPLPHPLRVRTHTASFSTAVCITLCTHTIGHHASTLRCVPPSVSKVVSTSALPVNWLPQRGETYPPAPRLPHRTRHPERVRTYPPSGHTTTSPNPHRATCV